MPAALPIAAPAVPPRRPLGTAVHAAGDQHTPRVLGSKRGRPAIAQKLSDVIESTVLFWGFTRDPEIRSKVRSQVRRLRRDRKRRYDPRLAAGIIAKRLHIPIIAVDEILQGSIPEFEEWATELRAGITRAFVAADARAAETWQRKTAVSKANPTKRDLRRRSRTHMRLAVIVEGVKTYVTTQPAKGNAVFLEKRA